MNNKLIALVYITLVIQSCSSTYNFVDYLKPVTNVNYVYDCQFLRAGKDTLFETIEVIYKTHLVEGEEILYSIRKRDLEKQNPIAGTSNFLFSVMLFKDNSVRIAPFFWKEELNTLKPQDFGEKFPTKVKQKDEISFKHNEKTIILTDFKIENLKTKNLGVIKGCLAFKKIVKRDSGTKEAYIWLHKKYGVVKWIRKTGRIEELKQFPIKQ